MGLLTEASRLVPSSSLAGFRVIWGLVMAYECYRYISIPTKLKPMSNEVFHFPFYGFEWIHIPSMHELKIIIWIMMLSAIAIAVGFLHRLASFIFAALFTYLWLIELADYLNHFYLVTIITLMCVCLPLSDSYAIDSFLFSRKGTGQVPVWTYWLLFTEISIVYLFAAYAKLNEDWLRGEPLRHWLVGSSRSRTPIIGPFLEMEYACYLFSYGGLVFDGLVPFLLLYKRTRPLGFALSAMFHGLNKVLFNIGIFPLAMCALTSVFISYDWPEVMVQSISRILPARFRPAKRSSAEKKTYAKVSQWTWFFIALFLFFNLVMPLRYLYYPGNVAWTEHGHRYSWRMKLRDKQCRGVFMLADPISGVQRAANLSKITQRQEHKMLSRPEMIVYFAHTLADDAKRATGRRPRVYAHISCSLNFRPPQQFIDPNVDLASQPVWKWPYSFITPLKPLAPELQKQMLWRKLLYAPRDLLKSVKDFAEARPRQESRQEKIK